MSRRQLRPYGSLVGTCLSGADLHAIDLTGAHLSEADLAGARLVGAQLVGTDFFHAHLESADLTGADLVGARLCCAPLTGAHLTGCNLTGARLTLADLTGLPPLLLQAGSNEALLDDSTRFAVRAAPAGVDVQLDITADVPHVFQAFEGLLDEADAALDRSARFITAALARTWTVPQHCATPVACTLLTHAPRRRHGRVTGGAPSPG